MARIGRKMIVFAAAATLAVGLSPASAAAASTAAQTAASTAAQTAASTAAHVAAGTAARAALTTGRASADTAFSGGVDAVSASSPTDAWAVGTQCDPSCSNTGNLILRWAGTRWSEVTSPDPGPKDNELNDVADLSPTDAWAVGSYGNSQCTAAATVILHWNGTTWSQASSPSPGAVCNYLSAISADSATDAWAVGQSCKFAVNTCQTLILHWNGTAWSRVPSPSPGAAQFPRLADVSADSPTDAWAIGNYCAASCSTQKTLTLHWNGTAWSKVASPNAATGTYYPSSVSADSPTDAWLVGSYCTTSTGACDPQNTLMMHWNGTAWSVVTSPNPGRAINSLNDVTALSPTDAWVVGGYCVPKLCTGTDAMILHWNGTTWSKVKSPNPGSNNGLDALGATSANDIWAAGATCAEACGQNANALILHWNGTAWSKSSG